jgi:hypothetical protein
VVQRTNLLTDRSPISAVSVLSPALFSGPVDWAWSVPFSEMAVDQGIKTRVEGGEFDIFSPA